MTREEFIDKAVLALASNPKFTDEISLTLFAGSIVQEAVKLANVLHKSREV